jgi:uncharacterized protein (TIGR00251 family)
MQPSCRLQIRAVPGSNASGVVGRHGDAWKVRLAAPPEKGRANDELVRLLANLLGLDRSQVSVVTGTSARDKLVAITGLDLAAVETLLDDASRRD